jgi:hypothetical protein
MNRGISGSLERRGKNWPGWRYAHSGPGAVEEKIFVEIIFSLDKKHSGTYIRVIRGSFL